MMEPIVELTSKECEAVSGGDAMASLATIRARLDFEDVVTSIPDQPADTARVMARLASEPFAIAIP